MSTNQGGPSRRTLVKGAAWSVPVVTMSAPVALATASHRIDPGINGWVLNTTTRYGDCWYDLRVNSNPQNADPTPDGAPFGLYLYDILPGDTITNAKITYWIIGEQREGASWSTNSGHSNCWGQPVKGPSAIKADGLRYTPYTWTYSCVIPPEPAADGRVWLNEFDVTARFRQPSNRCDNVTYWTQRSIQVNGEILTFERRNGTWGPYTGSGAPLGGAVDNDALNAEVATLDARLVELEVALDGAPAQAASDDGVDAAATTAAPDEPTTDLSALEAERAQVIARKSELEAQLAETENATAGDSVLPS